MMDYLSGKLFKCSGKETRHKAALGHATRQRSGLAAGSSKGWQQAVVKAGSKHCHGFDKAIGSKDT
jgi:hypothetical protein